jgi:hypothetical protein
MKKIKLCKISISVFCVLITMPVCAQNNFGYKAELGEIKETKFYKIDLPPQVVAKCKPGLEDIRIYNEKGEQVSYILKNDVPVFKEENFTAFPIVKNLKEADKQTHIILQNVSDKAVSNLLLFIKNTDARRLFSISGSDDNIHWFIIKENIFLHNSFNGNAENIAQILSFPPGNYKYFQLTILGENLLPFNLVKAGIYNEDAVYGMYAKIPSPIILQKDSSDKRSYINLRFDNKYEINKINLDINGPKYYKRKFAIFNGNKINDVLFSEGYLFSDSANSFIGDVKNDQLLLIVDNEDDVPLKLKTADAFQLNTCLLTYLKAGEKYHLEFGDSTLNAPEYDLQFFADSIEKNPSEISVNTIEKNVTATVAINSVSSENHQLLLWIAITIILFILCFFTFKMMKEVNKKNDGV